MTPPPSHPSPASSLPETAVAVVGLACHFPGAHNYQQFWQNLCDGVESTHFFSEEELRAAGVSESLLRNPNYVRAAPILSDVGHFDPAFWGISPKDAALMDPQHRHFLECAYEALEDAGHDVRQFDGSIGVYGGCGPTTYLMYNLLSNPHLVDEVGMFLLRHTNNDKDFLTTFTSYKLELEGPSVCVQTACSTSLVAIHLAAQQLLNGECDMALAGGSTVEVPHHAGYLYQEGEILSPDGHCRPFAADSSGTVFGSGAGVVVLRRLADALADGDTIRAVIRGSAVNNDGARKAGFLAPSVDGQAHAVAEALAVAEVEADTISFVECHGTGTPVGDPIEVAALTQAFRETTAVTGTCAIGSCKSNIGHIDTAAGVAGFIKAVEALRQQKIPPTLFFDRPNPLIELEQTPFYVLNKLQPWPRQTTPRRAGVNSLGVGGTNAHVILEEAPVQESGPSALPYQILPLSAKSPAALDAMTNRLADHLENHPSQSLADVAFTLQCGRRAMPYRRTLVATNHKEAVDLLRNPLPPAVKQGFWDGLSHQRSLTFLFPGGGSQFLGMAAELYRENALVRDILDRGIHILESKHQLAIRNLLLESTAKEKDFSKPSLQLPAVFLLEVALARLWMSWGFKPQALLGHSLGENTAAHLAGILSFEDALGLVALRGKLFEKLEPGGMCSVALSAQEIEPLLEQDLVVGVENTPQQCVVSGKPAAIATLQEKLAGQDVECRSIDIQCAAHSPALEPILEEFHAYLSSIQLHPPQIPIVSNRTGQWLSKEQATDPNYWVEHLRHPVRFADGVDLLLQQKHQVFLEVGPGKVLSSLVRQHPNFSSSHVALSSMRHRDEKVSDFAFLLSTVGQMWNVGVAIHWQDLHGQDTRLRIPLPTYPFERQKYWIDPGSSLDENHEEKRLQRLDAIEDWFRQESWRGLPDVQLPQDALDSPQRWLLFLDRHGLGTSLAERLRKAGQEVITVREGDTYYRFSDQEFALSSEAGRLDFDALIAELAKENRLPNQIVHLWTVTGSQDARAGSSMFHHNKECGFYSLFFLAQALGELDEPHHISLNVVSNGLQKVHAQDQVQAEKALLLGPVRVMPKEYGFLQTRSIDIDFSPETEASPQGFLNSLLPLFWSKENCLALRRGQAFAPFLDTLHFHENGAPLLGPENVLLITGGLGGLGLTIAEHCARNYQSQLVLLGRSSFPSPEEWDSWLESHSPEDFTSQRIHRIRQLQSLGSKVLVVQADVANLEEMQQMLEKVQQQLGKVTAVVHAAGVLEDGVMQMRTPEAAERVFTPKVHGTLVLNELFADNPLRLFLLCSSTSVDLAPAGQVDYVAANAFLNSFALAEDKTKETRVLALNWGIWSDLGMARNLANRLHGEDEVTGERLLMQSAWFEECIIQNKKRRTWLGILDVSQCWALDEHRLRNGKALLPGTSYLEIALSAWQDWGHEQPITLSDVQFLQPCEVAENTQRRLRIQIKKKEGHGEFVISSQAIGSKQEWITHATGKITTCSNSSNPKVDFTALQQKSLNRFVEAEAGSLEDPQQKYLLFGPRFQVQKSLGFEANCAFSRLLLDADFVEDFSQHPLHPALMDIGTGCGMELIPGYNQKDAMYIPLRYEKVEIFHPLQQEVLCRAQLLPQQNSESGLISFQVELCNRQGELAVAVYGFQMRRLDSRQLLKSNAVQPGTHRNTKSPAEKAFLESLEAGIQAADGMKALAKVLAGDPPSVFTVSSIDLEKLRKRQQLVMASSETKPSVKFQRPNLSSPFQSPETPIEKQLAEWWEELLGVEQVGVLDDFFEVGGHSLVAVRLFARIKKKWGVEYPLSVLFEAPTIRLCATLLEEEVGADNEEEDALAQRKKSKRNTYLVPLNDVRKREKAPFFLVAGMFGNVLNLRHLAAHLGADQPMYAIQARGLHGDDRPHRRFEDMARDYLAEIRTVQPHGPYLIGGFSGGGLTAYEMAHQLLEAGEEVASLIMLDTPIPNSPNANFFERLLIQWQRLRKRGPKHILEWPKKRIAWEIQQWKKKHSANAQNLAPAEFRSELIKEGFIEALHNYELRVYPGRLTIFRPPLDNTFRLPGGKLANDYREIQDSNNHWGPYIQGGIECFEVPGDHDSMVLEPHVRVLGSKVCQVLQTAQERIRHNQQS